MELSPVWRGETKRGLSKEDQEGVIAECGVIPGKAVRNNKKKCSGLLDMPEL